MASRLLLNVQNAEVSFGNRVLFSDLSFNIHEGDKICLVGKNGVGKSTLMNIITGQKDLDDGLRWQLQGITIGHVQQDIHPTPGQTVYDYIFEELKLENRDGSHDYKIDVVMEPLELRATDLLENLSGGQLRRVSLARALVESPDILLLDEPTNHLDLDIVIWLEGYLKFYPGAVVCISHDKAFLKAISDKVFWLDRGRLKLCSEGFEHFDDWSTALLEQEERELQRRQKKMDLEVEWASRGVKARRKRNIRRLEEMKVAREKLRSDKNALQRMLSKVDFTAMENDVSGTKVITEFRQVNKTYPTPNDPQQQKVILNQFNLRIMRGDRIGVIGKNGSGKTTFLKLLLKEIEPDSGTIKMARDMTVSYFDQKRATLRPEYTLQQVLVPGGGEYIEVMGKTRHVCSYLKDFLFDPKMAQQPVSTLSGGQKNRLVLAKVLSNPGSLLILDEPTNDLDMDTLDMLEDVLSQYTGTLLVVSHDRDFLDQTVNKVLAFEGDGKIDAVIGGYQDYLESKIPEKLPTAPRANKNDGAATKPKPKSQKLSYSLQLELDKLPSKIQALEEKIRTLEEQLSDPDLYTTNAALFDSLSQNLVTAKKELAQNEVRWLELEELRG